MATIHLGPSLPTDSSNLPGTTAAFLNPSSLRNQKGESDPITEFLASQLQINHSVLPRTLGSNQNNWDRGGSPLVPYLVLLRVGFTLPPQLLETRCALTTPFHPYRAQRHGGIFSVALSVNRPLRTPPRPLAGTLPCGDRTFLPIYKDAAAARPTNPT
jgi:hypothetical protein